jgi:monofunctional biosynthetic peptidoglycan transglycosylase
MKSFFFFLSIISLFLFCFSLTFIPPVYKLRHEGITRHEWDKDKGKITYQLYPGSPNWQNLSEVSQMTLSAITFAEDSKFYEHMGIDFNSILLSLKINYKAGYIKSGASTITQQVVRMAFLDSRKSYIRKIREIMGAILLEFFLSKKEILAWYINMSYFGAGSAGIRHASHLYFKTKPSDLNLNQSIYLALLLPNPSAYRKKILAKKLDTKTQLRFISILNELKNSGAITEQQWEHTIKTGDFGSPLTVEN